MPMWSFTPHVWFGVIVVFLFHDGITVGGALAVTINFIIYRMVINLFENSYNRQHYANPLLKDDINGMFSLSLFFIVGFILNFFICLLELTVPLFFTNLQTTWSIVVIRILEMLAVILLFADTQGPSEERKIRYAFEN